MRTRIARNVSLPPDLERFVLRLVGSGRYASASEVVRAALRLLERDEGGTLTRALLSSADQDREAAYREALAAGHLVVWETNFVTRIRQWTPEALSLFGLDLPTARGTVGGSDDEWLAAIHPEDRPRAEALYATMLRSDVITAEYRIRRPDGTTLWLSGNGKVTRRSRDGTPEKLVSIMADVTARKQAEEKLRASEERFRALVAMSTDWFWEQDEQFRFVEFSESVETLAHSSVRSHMGKTRWQLPALDVSEAQWQEHRALLNRHEPFRNFEYRRITEAGDIIWMSASGDPIFDAKGRFCGYRGIGTNITERKNHELLLDEQARLLELIATDAPIGGSLVALTTAVARLDPGAQACVLIFNEGGTSIEKVVAPTLPEAFGGDIRAASVYHQTECAAARWLDRLVAGTHYTVDEPALQPLFVRHQIRAIHATPIHFGDGHVVASFWLCFQESRAPTRWELRIAEFGAHITNIAIDRARTAGALAAKSRELERILDTAGTGLCRFDASLTFLAANRTFAEIIGCPLDEIIGRQLNDIRCEVQIVAMRPSLEEALAGNRVEFEDEVRTVRSSRWLHALFVPETDESGGVIGIVASITDVTENRRAEIDLRARDALLRSIAERARVGVYMVDTDLRYSYANPAYLDLLGLEQRDVAGVPVVDVIGPERLAEFREPYERALAGATVTFERGGTAPGATKSFAHWRHVSLQPFVERGGRRSGVIGVVLDITERKRWEQRQELLLRELAHRGKNLLAVIQSIARRTFLAEADIVSARQSFLERLQALSRTYSVLTAGHFEGAPLAAIVDNELGAMAGRLNVSGPELLLSDKAAQTFALILHELATNAIKHGAWSVPDGAVVAKWRIEGESPPRFEFTWREVNGPVPVLRREGFGSVLMRDVVASQFDTTPELSFQSSGFVYRFSALLAALEMQVDDQPQEEADGALS